MQAAFDRAGNLFLRAAPGAPIKRARVERSATTALLEAAFSGTGVDAHGHHWINHKQVTKDEYEQAANNGDAKSANEDKDIWAHASKISMNYNTRIDRLHNAVEIGTMNKDDASYQAKQVSELANNQAAAMVNHHWNKLKDEFVQYSQNTDVKESLLKIKKQMKDDLEWIADATNDRSKSIAENRSKRDRKLDATDIEDKTRRLGNNMMEGRSRLIRMIHKNGIQAADVQESLSTDWDECLMESVVNGSGIDSLGRKWQGGKLVPKDAAPANAGHAEPKRVKGKFGGRDVLIEVGADGNGKIVDGPKDLIGKTIQKKKQQSTAQPANAPSVSATAGEPRKSKAKVVMDDNSKTANDNWAKLSGGAPTQEIASLVGAPDDAKMDVYMGKDSALIDVDHSEYTAERIIGKDDNGDTYIKNSKFFLKEGKEKGTGLGSKIFSDQVANLMATADQTGIKYIQCAAARELGSGKQANGYYTWPRMGYDQSLSDYTDATPKEQQVLGTAAEKFGAKTILDVMSTKEGRDWWKENGCDLRNMKFDLDKDSRSMRIHSAYLEERKSR